MESIKEIYKIGNGPSSSHTMGPSKAASIFKERNPEAAEFFNSIESVNRYAIIYRLQTSRTPEIRAKKLMQFMEMLVRKEKIHN